MKPLKAVRKSIITVSILFTLIFALAFKVPADDITGPEPDEIETTTEAETTTETETESPAATNEPPTGGSEDEIEEETEPVTVLFC